MKKTRRTLRVLLSLCMAALLCISAFTMAGAADTEAAAKTVLYDNYFTGWSQVYCYAWNTTDHNVDWPGAPMTKDEYSACWTADIDTAYTHVIFTNGEGLQTFDLALLAKYDTFFGNKVEQGKVNGFWRNYNTYTNFYFFPSDKWDDADCYASYWDTNTPQSWPGTKMNYINGAYIIRMPGFTNLIINNGGNGKQTETIVPNKTNNVSLTGNIKGYDEYGNAVYEIQYNEPGPG